MQRVAAYLLEHDHGEGAEENCDVEAQEILEILRKWLTRKRADDPEAPSGEFRSESEGAAGRYRWERASHGSRSWRSLKLYENFADGRRFETSIWVIVSAASVKVYVSLASGLVRSTVAPVPVEAKCPRFIRSILDLHGDWRHGSTRIRKAWRVEGRENGRNLASEIMSPKRTLPIVLISESESEQVFSELDSGVAHEIAGLSNVVVVDNDGSWGITDLLGKEWSCYWGAVRLYWPIFSVNDNLYRHPLWTARRLIENDASSGDAMARLQAQIRRQVMRASALSVVRPREIDEVREQAARVRMTDRLNSVTEWKSIADSYAVENDELRGHVADLENEVTRLSVDLQNAEAQLGAQRGHQSDIEADSSVEEAGPAKGEVRFYKKTKSAPTHDILVRVSDCGHSAWQSSAKADKARKGLTRLEGRRDWKKMQHCGTCTGGGVWKVVW